MGPTVGEVFRRTEQLLPGQTLDVVDPGAQSGYDAVQVPNFRYRGSMETGKNLALQAVETKYNTCRERTQIVMAGFSQGAEAIYEALRVMHSDHRAKVRAVVLFGSPVHKPFQNGDAGPSHGIGIFAFRPIVTIRDGLPNRMRDYCNHLDPVCSAAGPALPVSMPVVAECFARGPVCSHLRYRETHADEAARYLADRLR